MMTSGIDEVLARGLRAGCYPGAIAQVSHAGTVRRAGVGSIASHGRDGSPIPPAQREPVRPDLHYDLASITKVFTAITVLSLADEGTLAMDEPIAALLPAFRTSPERRRITALHLLTHTSGLPPVWPGWQDAGMRARSREAILADIMAMPLRWAPGERLDYSCVGYITAMALAEQATGQGWEQLVTTRVLRPLGLAHTGFNPLRHGVDVADIAPTEFRPALGLRPVGSTHAPDAAGASRPDSAADGVDLTMVRGTVHDETAQVIGGVSGNAGMFSTLADLARLASALSSGLPGVLGRESFAMLWDDQLPRLLGGHADAEAARNGYRHGAGLCVAQTRAAGPDAPWLRSHTGFTGTSVVLNRAGDYAILLSNRVHPTRQAPDLAPVRVALTRAAGLVEPGGLAERGGLAEPGELAEPGGQA
ncbi:Beta-lactamase [Propionibacterium freudenreichii]|uniref:serine hydrolase domain-containing protein n=1 Tax=Propionibacterium freudenreichii TaxID=1744 RepID=UPI0005A5CC20|nr:serine hydrolase domain-containing protein [Propionibacterium freudenreichii]CEI26450.1 Beta-lactamase [Propionibacterium freudenreichii]